jgi:hypothetical protein
MFRDHFVLLLTQSQGLPAALVLFARDDRTIYLEQTGTTRNQEMIY